MLNRPMSKSHVATCIVFLAAALTTDASQFTVPSTVPGEDDWETYVDAPVLEPASAAGVLPGAGSAEAALTHFFASRLRGDLAYLDVVPPPEKKRPLYDALLSGMAPWSFQKFQLLARKPAGDSEVWIAVHLEVLVDGQSVTLDDAALLQLLDGQWYVAELPS